MKKLAKRVKYKFWTFLFDIFSFISYEAHKLRMKVLSNALGIPGNCKVKKGKKKAKK